MRKRLPKGAGTALGRPRLVNQVLVNRMVDLREQGFSHREIAEKVGRAERTVRRYTKGVSARVEVPTQPKRVDVLAASSQLIFQWRPHLEFDTQEVDALLKHLRKTLERKDPLTLEWFATDPRALRDFMLGEFLRDVMPHIDSMRHIRRIMTELRAAGGQVVDEEFPEDPGPSPDRLLPP